MKIRVVRAKDGRHENIILTEPLQVVEGQTLHKLISGTGTEHWFRPDGTYDGWGMDVSAVNLQSPQEAKAFIDAVEKEREFPAA